MDTVYVSVNVQYNATLYGTSVTATAEVDQEVISPPWIVDLHRTVWLQLNVVSFAESHTCLALLLRSISSIRLVTTTPRHPLPFDLSRRGFSYHPLTRLLVARDQ